MILTIKLSYMDKIEELLTRGVEDVIDKEHLSKALRSKKKLRVKLGIDPTSPNIHIGRAVVLWKLRAFQELGHKVIFIVGDFTGIIGDTSDKEAERQMMSEAEIKKNIKTYFAQAYKILDKKNSETHYNSKWLKKLNFKQVGELANLFGMHEFEARENIAKRLKQGKRVSVRELLYPLMQGYDSVAVKADVELGGTDQKFNLLAGRKIQKAFGQEPQDIMTTSLMAGMDGRKMSSSWGNVINITDEPNNMFGKVMSVDDGLIKKYFVLATRTPFSEIDRIMKELQNPRDQKLILAQSITSLYHGAKKAAQAKENFIKQFTNKELPDHIEEKKISPPRTYKLSELLKLAGLAGSKGEARRLIEQKGVKVKGVVSTDVDIALDGKKEYLLQVGKRKFLKVK
ncbi:MAG: tyrosine--tRNA ligase [Candidatus Doudnabacteria bacterium CG10_big_fil_rev_8_21_14_0_10_42_18]|uniref:Tyrosine--tRNA ligase n=1 Tax=Candidatus Doudnabacteria bacterium CG10_big_fil_rev_8_21_14_0_10_42_18 TaxID=1974552 RepID=A0A2H0VBF7_9BACT|nr:MAG: tyrosine--tRNA ligase [Candidatus Doudnabacteria bacterium CG10_big_fil_rev_8_21_14_0_10_42_18]